MMQQMLYGKCIFSQNGTPDFQTFLDEHGSPLYSSVPYIVVPFFWHLYLP